jgi:hypothetical protein
VAVEVNRADAAPRRPVAVVRIALDGPFVRRVLRRSVPRVALPRPAAPSVPPRVRALRDSVDATRTTLVVTG